MVSCRQGEEGAGVTGDRHWQGLKQIPYGIHCTKSPWALTANGAKCDLNLTIFQTPEAITPDAPP